MKVARADKGRDGQAYYPFAAEKEILERFGDEIACRMFGLPSSVLLGDDGSGGGEDAEGEKVYERTGAGNKPADKEKWFVPLPLPSSHSLADARRDAGATPRSACTTTASTAPRTSPPHSSPRKDWRSSWAPDRSTRLGIC